MCGLAGLMTKRPVRSSLLRDMTAAIAHRGPDDESFWIDQDARIGLGHRRLAIVDLSPLGRQPMVSSDGRWVLAYNGEIYNHRELRARLEQSGEQRWRGGSDTETLVECIAAWGLEQSLSQCVGMFAFALWDRRDRRLHLVRDRFGEKPLYYGWVGDDFLFASELKSIELHPGFTRDVDRSSLRTFACRSYIPAPHSIFKHIYKLEPGCILSVSREALGQRPSSAPAAGFASPALSVRRYWRYRDAVVAGLADPIADEEEAADRLEIALADAIKGQSVADVPVGAFLSGGIDSSLVVGSYQKYSSRPVRTFSIGFAEARYNEADHAKAVAAHFGTEHHERYVTVGEAQGVLPLLPSMYDEPFADSSQIPTYLVSRFARDEVTVAITGDGGDELFGGYNRYLGTALAWSYFSRLPAPARKVLGTSIGKMPPGGWNALVQLLPGGRGQPAHFGDKVRKTFRTMGNASSLEDLFASLVHEWGEGAGPVLGLDPSELQDPIDLDLGVAAPDAVRMMYGDATSFLPDDVLCKVDRASMAVSLETRAPFLDHRLAELAARIPLSMKIRGNRGKLILRRLLYRQAPAALFERPKKGFMVPVGEWIRGALRPWAEELLDERRLSEEGFFDAAQVRARWHDHLSGRRDAKFELWSVLMFQAWLDQHRSAPEQRQSPGAVPHWLTEAGQSGGSSLGAS
jgi:asparagine synthase (glutamine-hydrolysing)